ncbi:MAG: adenine phosphoribosyltransferase [Phycisphaerales bacterium]|nr:adenine phosphoribosyltransferase [Phycisphaerales bacterium]
MEALTSMLEQFVRDVPDFPRKGIVFKDVTPLLADPGALAMAVELMANPWRGARIDAVVGAESRGFIFGTAVAQALNTGFVPMRKPGKLPAATFSIKYELEYGSDALHVHQDALVAGARVLVVDDLLATGGTMRACIQLVRMTGALPVAASVFIELPALGGRAALAPMPVHSVLRY